MDMIVGLGNPGTEYSSTRHNVGFRVLDLLAQDIGIRLDNKRFQSRNARARIEGKDVMLLCPMTYMNLSGNSVRLCADYYKIEKENILVIHDDLDLPVGRIKVARQGGAGGHKGVQSIIDHLGGTRFPRIKIGIGRPRYNETTEDFVLAPFYKDQRDIVEGMLQTALEACRLILKDCVSTAMNRINSQKPSDKKEENNA
jgi:peptidyl-tRNA hydrolase, PTH1 family